jgi:hypothetical protein
MNKIKQWLHDKLEWGFPQSNHPIGGDGFQPTYECRFCSKELAQDSQGNYFHLS